MATLTRIVLFVFFVSTAAHAAPSSSLRVLLVGNDPAKETVTDVDRMGKEPEKTAALRRERTPAFEQLLKSNFKTVKIVYATDYKEAMSDGYDVTVFDALPTPIRKEVLEKDASGKPIGFKPAQYLSDHFSAAALLISANSPKISEPLEYKMDWLCECLGKFAHNIHFEHPIFNTPNKVKLTIKDEKTPANYAEYFSGQSLPETMPMWRVQTVGYEDEGSGMPAGLVSSGQGFTDGGDAEIISNGTNQKSVRSVSLARHANLFHWGYSASPMEMTDEAKQVFVNAVVYIAQFKGAQPYSHRPYQSAFNNRQMGLDIAYLIRSKGYEDYLKSNEAGQKAMADMKANLKASGAKLTDEQRKFVDSPTPPPPTREDWMKTFVQRMVAPSMYAKVSQDTNAYLPYYEANLPYLKRGPSPMTFEVDEDAHSLGVANNNPEILELCLAMLESNLNVEKAQRVLSRYTGEKYTTAAEWRTWLNANRDRLYFSDEDGYRFHVIPASAVRSVKAATRPG